MGKEVTFRDILVKITKVLSSDLYLINNQFIMGGHKSDENNIGYYLYRLSPAAMTASAEHFKTNKVYYISDGKAAKDSLENNFIDVTNELELKQINDKKDEILRLVKKTDIWKSFNFSEDDITTLFSDNSTLELFKDDKDIPSVTVSKTLFPYITEKNVSKLYYNVIKKSEYTNLLLSLDYDMFQLYMLYKYIALD